MIEEHPVFAKVREMPEPWRSHFPKSSEEARDFKPLHARYALANKVLAVANTRVECAWCAYCDAVEGENHKLEQADVLRFGSKLDEKIARVLFPQFDCIGYAS